MNASQCQVFRELSQSIPYHIISTFKGALCLIGAVRISKQWMKYGVRFLVHNNTKTMFRFYFALNIMIGLIFAFVHLSELVRLRFDCLLLDFRYILLTRCLGICTVIASQHIILVLSFERLYSTIFPAHFEKHSSKILATLLASATILTSYWYGILMVSNHFTLFKDSNLKLALLSPNIPQNQANFEKLARNVALLNCVSFATLSVDIYLNFFRKPTKSSLSVSYQRSENRRILLTLIPIEMTQTIIIIISASFLMVYRTVFPNPTPMHKQLFHETVTVTSCLPLIISFIVKYSIQKNTYRAPPKEVGVDNIESLHQIWEDEFGKKKWDGLCPLHKCSAYSKEDQARAALNLFLFYLVVISKRASTSDPVYKIAISFFSVHGFMLCTIIAVFCFGHAFREGTFVATALSPIAQFIPMPLNRIIFKFLLILLAMMWTLIPATSTLQLITLSHRHHWGRKQRLFVSFLFPFLCGILVTSTVEDFMPSQAFEKTLLRISQEFYEVNSSLIVFGGTMRYWEENYDRTLTYFAVFYAIIPYSFTYAALGILIFQIQKKLRVPGIAASERTLKMQRAFFTMQLLQSVLPLAILATPFTVFVYCVFTQTDLTLIALWFTSFLWLCPAVQALVQLRYIRQAMKARMMEATTITVSVVHSKTF